MCALFTRRQGRALVREALASAAVVLWAASLLPAVEPGAAAAAFGQGLFFAASPTVVAGATVGSIPVYDSSYGSGSVVDAAAAVAAAVGTYPPLGGWLDEWFRSRGSSLVAELHRFSPIGRICSLKGLVTAMPKVGSMWERCRCRVAGSAAVLMSEMSCAVDPRTDCC